MPRSSPLSGSPRCRRPQRFPPPPNSLLDRGPPGPLQARWRLFLIGDIDADELPEVVFADELQVEADTACLILEAALQEEDAVIDLGLAAGADVVGDNTRDIHLLVAEFLENLRELFDG